MCTLNDAAARIEKFACGCIRGFLLPQGSPFGKEIAAVARRQFLKHKELKCVIHNPLPGMHELHELHELH